MDMSVYLVQAESYTLSKLYNIIFNIKNTETACNPSTNQGLRDVCASYTPQYLINNQ